MTRVLCTRPAGNYARTEKKDTGAPLPAHGMGRDASRCLGTRYFIPKN